MTEPKSPHRPQPPPGRPWSLRRRMILGVALAQATLLALIAVDLLARPPAPQHSLPARAALYVFIGAVLAALLAW